MKRFGVVTSNRADFGLLRPLLKAMQKKADAEAWLYVTGGHLLESQGRTVEKIRQDGFEIRAELPGLGEGDEPSDIAKAMAKTTAAFADQFKKELPDLLVVLGDRFEMHAAALAAVPFNLCLAHIHGGEATQGAIDDVLRHSLTKLSHLHFASHPAYARRIIQMGEEPWRVSVCGAPGLENLHRDDLLSDAELESLTGLAPGEQPVVVTFHPPTLEADKVRSHCDAFYQGLDSLEGPVLVTAPNPDTRGSIAAEAAKSYADKGKRRLLAANLGDRGYFSLLKRARAMAGNSSSGILEAASFELPVLNVGERQKGRLHGANVIDCPCETPAIKKGLERVLDPSFRQSLKGLKNPYDQGGAASAILRVLMETQLDAKLLHKHFHDLPGEGRP